MVEYINETLMDAGTMNGIWGVVIHNDAGRMTPKQYISWLRNRDKALGIAHYYINRDQIVRVIDTNKIAYHAANAIGNGHYIGYEVCESLKVSDADFLANEDMTLRQAAEDMHYYGFTPSKTTVKLHKQFSTTTCPHRSTALHQDPQQYFIDRIAHFMSLGKTVDEMLANEIQTVGNAKQEYVEPIRVPVSYNAKIKSAGYSIDSRPWGEAGFECWGNTDNLTEREFYFYEENASGEYANGMGLGWVDKRALEREKQVVASILYLPNGNNWIIYPESGPYTAGDVISLEGPKADAGLYLTILGDKGNNVVVVDLPNFGVVGLYYDEDKGASIEKKYA